MFVRPTQPVHAPATQFVKEWKARKVMNCLQVNIFRGIDLSDMNCDRHIFGTSKVGGRGNCQRNFRIELNIPTRSARLYVAKIPPN